MAKYRNGSLNGNILIALLAIAGCAAVVYFLTPASKSAPGTGTGYTPITKSFSTPLGHSSSAPSAPGDGYGNDFTEYVNFGEPAPYGKGEGTEFSFDTAPAPSGEMSRPYRREKNSDAKAVYQRSFVPRVGSGMHRPMASDMLPNRSAPVVRRFPR